MATRKQAITLAAGIGGGYVAGYLTPLGRTAAALVAACVPVPPPAAHEGRYQGVSVVVQSVTRSKGDEFNTPKPGHVYLILHVLITNRGAANARYNALDFALQAANATVYTTQIVTIADAMLTAGVMGPGQRIAGDVVFQVAPTGRYHLRWTPGFDAPAVDISLPHMTS